MNTTTKTKYAPALLFDADAEASVLSAAFSLEDSQQINELELSASMFGLEKHQYIFSAMQRIVAQGGQITPEQVRYQLEANDRLDHAGGLEYLIRLNTLPALPSHIRSDADLVYRFYVKRNLANAATEIAAVAFDSANFSSDQIVEVARRKLEQIQVRESADTDPWQVQARTLADAFAPREPLFYIVDGMFAAPSLSIVFGAPGTLKSMLLADMCICVAAGLNWLEPLPDHAGQGFVTKQAPVMWLDFDNGRNRTDERFEAIAKARGVDASVPLTYYSMPSPWLDASSTKDVDALISRAQERGAGMIVIDNLGVVAGGVEENSAAMASVMANLRRVAEDVGAAVIVIHHQRKMNSTAARAGDALRGHSSIEAALDLALLVEREPRAESVSVKATKARGADVAPFGAMWTFEHKETTKDLSTARFWSMQIEDNTSDKAIERVVIEIVTTNAGIAKTELATQVQKTLPAVGVNRARGVIERLLEPPGAKLKTITSGSSHAQRVQLAE